MRRNRYDFYLGNCLLPIAPQKLQTKINNANKTITLINEGQVNVLKSAELTDIEFECILPQVEYPFAVYKLGFKRASYFLDYFETLKTSKKPFRFIVSRAMPSGKVLFATNMKVSMESYTITEQAKDAFDVTVKIKLKQYRDYSTKVVNLTSGESGTEGTIENPRPSEGWTLPTKYTVVAGDCLWTIAKRFYNNGSLYTKIKNANKPLFEDRTPNMIYPGDVLLIPAI